MFSFFTKDENGFTLFKYIFLKRKLQLLPFKVYKVNHLRKTIHFYDQLETAFKIRPIRNN